MILVILRLGLAISFGMVVYHYLTPLLAEGDQWIAKPGGWASFLFMAMLRFDFPGSIISRLAKRPHPVEEDAVYEDPREYALGLMLDTEYTFTGIDRPLW